MVVTPGRNAVLSGTKVSNPQQNVMRGLGFTLSTSNAWINESRARTIGAVFPQQSDGGPPGQYHADPTALTTADAIGDSFRMCTSCQEFALREAIASGRTKTVRDPNFERVFTPSGPHQGGFGRASITKTAKGPRQLARAREKPTIRREQALAFPSGVTVAEQSHRPGQTKVRFPSSARHLLPDDVATSDRPLLSRRAPRPKLGLKGETSQVEGTVTTNDTDRRIRFATDEGVVEVTASGGQVQSFHLTPSSASGAEGTMTLSRGERPELVSGAAQYRPALGSARNLPALPASTSASRRAPARLTTTTTTSTTPPSFSLPAFSTTSSSAPPVLPVPSSTSLSSRPSPSPSSRPPSTLPAPSPSSSQTTEPTFDFSADDAWLLEMIEKGLI